MAYITLGWLSVHLGSLLTRDRRCRGSSRERVTGALCVVYERHGSGRWQEVVWMQGLLLALSGGSIERAIKVGDRLSLCNGKAMAAPNLTRRMRFIDFSASESKARQRFKHRSPLMFCQGNSYTPYSWPRPRLPCMVQLTVRKEAPLRQMEGEREGVICCPMLWCGAWFP